MTTTTTNHVTATAARKAAKTLGSDHPAVIEWRRIARSRVCLASRANASDCGIANPATLGDALEKAKLAMIEVDETA